MHRHYFAALEQAVAGHQVPLNEVIDQLAFNEQGLIPVITQDVSSKEILMFAWMNKEALQLTLSTQRVTYWSRSRQQLWVKGETSGHVQHLVSMAFDCDGDTILCQVEQAGPACHTGRRHCFYLKVDHQQQQVVIESSVPAPEAAAPKAAQ